MPMLRAFNQERIVLTLAIILFAIFSIGLNGFLTPPNIIALLRSVAVLGVLSLAMVIVVIGRGIDLSLVANMAISVAWTFQLANSGTPLGLAMLLGLGFAVLMSLIAGILVEPVSFSERTPEPSYFHRPSPVAKDPVDAEVIWFNASKGFGFVKLSDGTEVYLHARALEAAGSRGVSDGTRLKLTVEDSPRGQQVSQVLEIGDQDAKTPANTSLAGEAIAGTNARLESEGTVKWYNPDKGFGFIAPDHGEKDVFVHATTLSRSGLRARQTIVESIWA